MPPIIITSNKRFDKWVDFRGDASITTAISGLPAVIIDKNGRTSILLTDEKNGFFYIVITSSGIDFETSSKIAKNLII